MPRRKYAKKRTYRRRRKRPSTYRPSGFGRQLLGKQLATTLIWNEQINLNAGAYPAVAAHIFSANGIFKPIMIERGFSVP